VLIDVIAKVWDQARIDRLLAWIQDLLAHRDDVLAPLAAVIEARITLRAQVSVSVTPEPASAARTKSAAMGRNALRDAPPADAPDAAEDLPIAWYASWVAARTVRARESGAFPNRFQNEHLIGFDYKHVKKETMEAIAFHSAWAMPVTEGLLLHAFSLEQGDVLSNLHIIALDAIDFGLVVGGKGQIPRWYHWTFKQLMTMFLWGFESGWDRVGADNDPYVWTNAAGDLGEVLLYWRWSFLLRELLLSFLTLLNHDKTSVIVAEIDEEARDAEACPPTRCERARVGRECEPTGRLGDSPIKAAATGIGQCVTHAIGCEWSAYSAAGGKAILRRDHQTLR
jgi:hypothetical protein